MLGIIHQRLESAPESHLANNSEHYVENEALLLWINSISP